MLRQTLRTLARTALLLGAAAAMSAACTRQAEGERCDYEWAADQDCADGLICRPCGDLQASNVDRCCPADGSNTDPRCTISLAATGVACNSHHANPGVAGNPSVAGSSGTTSEPGGGGEMSAGGTGG
jgi:hypothetical protein